MKTDSVEYLVISSLRTVLKEEALKTKERDILKRVSKDEKARAELACRVAVKMEEDDVNVVDFINAGWLKRIWMIVSSTLAGKRAEGYIPDDVLKEIARLLLPNIKAFFESEEGKAEFAKWKAEQENEKNLSEEKTKSEEKSPL